MCLPLVALRSVAVMSSSRFVEHGTVFPIFQSYSFDR